MAAGEWSAEAIKTSSTLDIKAVEVLSIETIISIFARTFNRNVRAIDGTNNARNAGLFFPGVHALHGLRRTRKIEISLPKMDENGMRYVVDTFEDCRTPKAKVIRDGLIIRALHNVL